MNIIICGAGRVGFTIAKLLSEQGHSITVIDQSSDDIQKINDSLDVKAIVGKATFPSILEKANAIVDNRKLMGATNPEEAEDGTIRKKYGISIDKNSVHGSDSVENAKIEIDFFFKD